MNNNGISKGISVIVCCYNSSERLPATLGYLIKQKVSGFGWELIIVDNASSDATSDKAKKILSDSGINYSIVYESEPGLSNARKKGYITSKYDFLIFCDDDNWLDETYLQNAFSLMNSNPLIGIAGGKGEAVFETEKPVWFDKYQSCFAIGEQTILNGDSHPAESYYLYGAGFVLRKTIFQKLDSIGFKSLLTDRTGNIITSGGDSELCILAHYLGYKVIYTPDLKFKHFMPGARMTYNYLKNLHFSFGRSNIYLHIYRYSEHSDTPPSLQTKLPFWIDTLIHKIKDLVKFMFRHPSVFFPNIASLENELRLNVMKGEIFEITKLKDNYRELFKRTIDLRKVVNNLAQKELRVINAK